VQASLGNISKCYCALSQFSLLFSSLNADPGTLQDSSVGAAGQAAIERPQGIMGITLVCSKQGCQGCHLLIILPLCALLLSAYL